MSNYRINTYTISFSSMIQFYQMYNFVFFVLSLLERLLLSNNYRSVFFLISLKYFFSCWNNNCLENETSFLVQFGIINSYFYAETDKTRNSYQVLRGHCQITFAIIIISSQQFNHNCLRNSFVLYLLHINMNVQYQL